MPERPSESSSVAAESLSGPCMPGVSPRPFRMGGLSRWGAGSGVAQFPFRMGSWPVAPTGPFRLTPSPFRSPIGTCHPVPCRRVLSRSLRLAACRARYLPGLPPSGSNLGGPRRAVSGLSRSS